MKRPLLLLIAIGFILAVPNNLQSKWIQTNGPYGGRIRCFVVSDTNLFAGTLDHGVFLSTNSGTSWTAASTGLTNPHIYALAVSNTNLFVGTWGGGVFRSTNSGAGWTAVNSGLTNTNVSSFAVSHRASVQRILFIYQRP